MVSMVVLDDDGGSHQKVKEKKNSKGWGKDIFEASRQKCVSPPKPN